MRRNYSTQFLLYISKTHSCSQDWSQDTSLMTPSMEITFWNFRTLSLIWMHWAPPWVHEMISQAFCELMFPKQPLPVARSFVRKVWQKKKNPYNRFGGSLKKVGPPFISRVHTSRMNHPTCPTAHPMRSLAAALKEPLSTQEKATRAMGR